MALDWVTWVDIETGKEKEALDGKSYELYKQSRGVYNRYLGKNDYIYFLESLGYNIEWPYTDFYSDGLRFSTNNNFS